MKVYNARANNLFLGQYRNLYVVGVGRAANGASDFTDADTSQIITLQSLAAGDGVDYPLARAYCKIAFAGSGLAAVAVKVGHTDDDDFFIASGSLLTAGLTLGAVVVSAGAGGPYSPTSAKAIILTIDTTGANLNALTAGEIWVYANPIFKSEALDMIDA